MREHYEKQIAILEDAVSLMESGRMETKSMTSAQPVWKNTTADNITRDKQTIEMLKGVIAKYYPLADGSTD